MTTASSSKKAELMAIAMMTYALRALEEPVIAISSAFLLLLAVVIFLVHRSSFYLITPTYTILYNVCLCVCVCVL